MSEEGKFLRFPGFFILLEGLFPEIKNTNLKLEEIGTIKTNLVKYPPLSVQSVFNMQRPSQILMGSIK